MVEKTVGRKFQRDFLWTPDFRQTDVLETQCADTVDPDDNTQIVDSGGNREFPAEKIPVSPRIPQMINLKFAFGQEICKTPVFRFFKKGYDRISFLTEGVIHIVIELQAISSSGCLRKPDGFAESARNITGNFFISAAVLKQFRTLHDGRGTGPDLPSDGFLHILTDRRGCRNGGTVHMAVAGVPAERIVRGFWLSKVAVLNQIASPLIARRGKPCIGNFLKIKRHTTRIKRKKRQ